MYIDVSRSDNRLGVGLHEPDDFKSFKIVVHDGVSPDEARAALAGIADLTSHEHGHASIDAVRTLSGRAADDQWCSQYDAMIHYAESKGWTTREGHIDAHCEWTGGEVGE